jgi:hypothetical protein
VSGLRFSSGLLFGKFRASFSEVYYIRKRRLFLVLSNRYVLPSSVKNSEH